MQGDLIMKRFVLILLLIAMGTLAGGCLLAKLYEPEGDDQGDSNRPPASQGTDQPPRDVTGGRDGDRD